MLSCTEFIPAYNELFKFLHSKGGKDAVLKYWEHLSEHRLTKLKDSARKKGLLGCFEYWESNLNEEAADFRMTLDENETVLTIEMRYCPSMGRLLEEKHIEPYAFYCQHCDTLYRRALEPLGFEYDIDLSQCHHARCTLTVRKKSDNDGYEKADSRANK